MTIPWSRAAAAVALTIAMVMGCSALATAEASAAPKTFNNCTEMHKVYPGGVAKNKKAAMRTTGRYYPKISKKLYKLNTKMDRDKDGIACEA